MAFKIREYVTSDDRNPFREWLASLDITTRARIQARVFRFEMGNLGDHKSVGAGVWEARLAFGPGYRIYFGREGQAIVLLLGGGTKASQSRDIRRARDCWQDYMEAKRHGETQ